MLNILGEMILILYTVCKADWFGGSGMLTVNKTRYTGIVRTWLDMENIVRDGL